MGGNPTLEEFEKNLPTFRFTVLRHDLPLHAQRECHWDLLLEPPDNSPDAPHLAANATLFYSAAGLLTFEVPMQPEEWNNNQFAVKRLPDHRLVYLNYEGPISGDRGHVKRVQSGFIQWKVLAEDLLVLSVRQTWPKETESIGLVTIAKLPGNSENSWELEWRVETGP